MHLRLPVPPGMARNNDRASSRSRSLYTHPTDPLNFVEYGTSVRLAKACCLNQAVTPTARPDATYMLLDQLGPGLPYVSFSKSKIAPVAQEGVFHTTVALQYLKVEPTDCTVDAWASDGLESGFGSFLQGSGAAGVGAGAAGVGNFGGSGGGGVGGGGGLVSAGPSRRSGSGGVIPPLLLCRMSRTPPTSNRATPRRSYPSCERSFFRRRKTSGELNHPVLRSPCPARLLAQASQLCCCGVFFLGQDVGKWLRLHRRAGLISKGVRCDSRIFPHVG
jgi:hypothetical protein